MCGAAWCAACSSYGGARGPFFCLMLAGQGWRQRQESGSVEQASGVVWRSWEEQREESSSLQEAGENGGSAEQQQQWQEPYYSSSSSSRSGAGS